MSESPLISVIVPVYNCEEYLDECVESILMQTNKRFELILIDDGSTDKSTDICDKYSEKSTNIVVRVIHKNNEGACFARRDGVRNAKGEYICFVDGDDTISSGLIDILTGAVEKYNPDIISYGMQNGNLISCDLYDEGYYEGTELEKIKILGFFSQDINEGRIIASPCTKLYRKDLIAKYLEKAASGLTSWEDMNYAYAPIFDAKSMCILHDVLYNYRVNEKSVSKSYNWGELSGTLYSLECAEKVYKEQSEEMLTAFYGYSLRIVWGCFDRYFDFAMRNHVLYKMYEYMDKIRFSEFVIRAYEGGHDVINSESELYFYEKVFNGARKSLVRKIILEKIGMKIKRIPRKLSKMIGIIGCV